MNKYNLLVKSSALCVFFIILLTPFSPLYSINLQLKLPFEKGSTFILTRGYNTQTTHVGKDNFALDFTAGGCDSYDAPVLAATAGVIERVSVGHVHGEVESYGNSIVINHGDGILSRYGHLNQVFVTSSEQVVQGQIIGTQGNTGSVWGTGCKAYPGTHLHFVMYTRGEDGTLTPYLPEPMSSYTDFVKGKEYTSDNEIIDDVIPESIITENPPKLNTDELVQPDHPFFVIHWWQKLSMAVVRSASWMASVITPDRVSEAPATVQTEVEQSVQPTTVSIQTTEPVFTAMFAQSEILVTTTLGQKEVVVPVKIQNNGTGRWGGHMLSLNVVGGLEANAMWYHSSWITRLRPTVVETPLEPRSTVIVPVKITIPATNETRFRLQLVRVGAFTQVGTSIVTIVLQPEQSPVSSQTPPSQQEQIEHTNDSETGPTETLDSEVEQKNDSYITVPTTSSVRSGGGRPSQSSEPIDAEAEDPTPTSTPPETPTTTDDDVPTTTEDVVTSTDPLLALGNLEFITPEDVSLTWYSSVENIVLSGSSDTYTETIVVEYDGVLVTTSPTGGLWEIPLTFATGTHILVVYGTASEGRQTSSTPITLVVDTEGPMVDVQLQNVADGLITIELTPYDDTPVTGYVVDFFQVVTDYLEEGQSCDDGLFSFDTPIFSYYIEGGYLFVELDRTASGCGFITGIYEGSDTVWTHSYDDTYRIAVRARGVDSAGNESEWWYSAVPLYEPYIDPGDVEMEL
jgi:murein DD-endopeptidase MepM/ murein hydrolase activator NlpD